MTTTEARATAITILTELGFTDSGSAWADDDRGIVYAPSSETHGPATYHHPVAEVTGRRESDGSWTFWHNNRPITPPWAEGAEIHANRHVCTPEAF